MPRAVIEGRACERCGAAFASREPTQRYCSVACRKQARVGVATTSGLYAHRVLACERCGASFSAVQPTARFCSARCRDAATRYGRHYGQYAPRQFGVWRRGGAG